MGLLATAREDVRSITENLDDFGEPVDVWDPAGRKRSLKGLTKHVGQAIDPGTGLLVSGMTASVALPMAALAEAGLAMPVGTYEGGAWLVAFAGADGKTMKFKVRETTPDRTLGLIVCILENWAG